MAAAAGLARPAAGRVGRAGGARANARGAGPRAAAGRREARVAARAVAAAAPTGVEALASCDIPLRFDSAPNVHVAVYGVIHCTPRGEIGDALLASQAAAVVVETAASPAHGSERMATITLEEAAAIDEPCVAKMCAGCAMELSSRQQSLGEQAGADAYAAVRANMGGEQLAYVTAWLSGAKLVFGDRPKKETWRRLMRVATASSADACFTAANIERYYEEILPQLSDAAREAATAALADDIWRDVAIVERDVVLLHSLREAAEAEEKAAAAEGRDPRPVVGVVGEAHVEGILRHAAATAVAGLPTGGVMLAADGLEPLAPLVGDGGDGDGGDSGMDGEEALVARACLEMVTAMRCNPEVVQDMMDELGDVMEGEPGADAYAGAFWLYGAALPGCAAGPASLPPALADELRSAWPRGSDADGLEELRALRPGAGGPGYAQAPEDVGGARWAVPGPPCEAAGEETAAREGGDAEGGDGSPFVDVTV